MASLPRMRQLRRELLLDIIDAISEDRTETKICQDMSSLEC